MSASFWLTLIEGIGMVATRIAQAVSGKPKEEPLREPQKSHEAEVVRSIEDARRRRFGPN